MYMVKFTLARSHLLIMNAEMHFYEKDLGKKILSSYTDKKQFT